MGDKMNRVSFPELGSLMSLINQRAMGQGLKGR